MTASTGNRRVLIIVENLAVPFDRRVWSEATTLAAAGCVVSVISPAMKNFATPYEEIEGVHVYRHPLRQAENSALGYFKEYIGALHWQLRLAFRVKRERGFDVVHACNPPDLIFLVAFVFKFLFGARFIFDHHDLCPELYEAKFGRRGFFWRVLLAFERLTFALADVSIATNESYRRIAIERGRMKPRNVFVVRSGPNVEKLRIGPANPAWKKEAGALVGYVGVIGRQEGLDILIAAARALSERRGRKFARYCVVGGGPDLEAVKALADTEGVGDLFTFTGRAPDQVLLEILNSADICVNPDRPGALNNLSTMNKIMEYMTLGKPIVQFDLHEGRQSAGPASLYARAGDADDFARQIEFLIDHPQERRRMGALGRERILSALSWEHSKPHLLAAYERAFAHGARKKATHAAISPPLSTSDVR
jgi:glycosyltransferase involved in cell wall biosynthesis